MTGFTLLVHIAAQTVCRWRHTRPIRQRRDAAHGRSGWPARARNSMLSVMRARRSYSSWLDTSSAWQSSVRCGAVRLAQRQFGMPHQVVERHAHFVRQVFEASRQPRLQGTVDGFTRFTRCTTSNPSAALQPWGFIADRADPSFSFELADTEKTDECRPTQAVRGGSDRASAWRSARCPANARRGPTLRR